MVISQLWKLHQRNLAELVFGRELGPGRRVGGPGVLTLLAMLVEGFAQPRKFGGQPHENRVSLGEDVPCPPKVLLLGLDQLLKTPNLQVLSFHGFFGSLQLCFLS